jgi:hypothetical protein
MRMKASVVALILVLQASAPAGAAQPDLPKRKSGLWEMKISGLPNGMGMPTMHNCVDQKTDDMWDADPTGSGATCSKHDFRKDGGRIIHDSVCKIDDSTVTTRSVFTGSFDSAFRGDMKSTYQPPIRGTRDISMVVEGKWLGPCKPGQKAGDVIAPDLPDMMKRGTQK